MDLVFIQAAAPASQPVPLTDTTASPAAFEDGASAFDAALAETLSSSDAGAVKASASANVGRATQPAWLLASLFTATLTGSPLPTDAPSESEAGAAAEGEVPAAAGASSEDEPTDPAVTAGIVVATPWPADAAPAVVPTAPVQNSGREQGTGMDVPAGQNVVQPAAGRVADAAANAPVDVPAPQAPATTIPASKAAALTTTGDQTNDVAAAPIASAGIAGAADGAERATAGIEPPNSVSRQMRSGERARAAFGEVVPPPAESTAQQANASAATPVTPGAVTNVAAAVAPAASATETARPQTVESGAAQGFAIPSHSAAAGQDAPMSGQDQSNGQGRPTPEFMRFAAALAQVTPAGSEDAGHAPTAAVAAPQAAASPNVAAPIAAVATAPVAQEETPGPDNVGRLVQAMRVIARPGAWEANVRLNPEHLGDVSIAIRVERNTVSAVVNAEGAGVRQWLESQEDAVRSGMAEHGLQLDRFIVQRDGQRRDAQPQQEQQGRRQAPRRQAATAERFEVVV